jgi:tartrate dehydrogenase/decarboxylase/D-malate dehydrogenase
VHGSAPDIYGRNIANPVAMIWSGALMLDFLTHGQGAGKRRARRDRAAIEQCSSTARARRDLGGNASTTEMGEAIAARVGA